MVKLGFNAKNQGTQGVARDGHKTWRLDKSNKSFQW